MNEEQGRQVHECTLALRQHLGAAFAALRNHYAEAAICEAKAQIAFEWFVEERERTMPMAEESWGGDNHDQEDGDG